jgi:pilus assembly protein Flp/PilA
MAVNHWPQAFGRRPQRKTARCPADLTPQWLTGGWGMHGLTRLLRCEKGANAIEYALVATLISIAAISAFHNLGNKIDIMYNNVGNAM